MNRPFSKEGIQAANKEEKMFKLLVIREIQIKMIMMYHLTTPRIVVSQKMANSKYWGECGKTGTLVHC